jgi:hypothetical protein
MGVDGVKKIAYSINSLIINAAGYLNSYQSSTLTQILKTEISPTLFTSLAHLQTAQLKGNQTLQLLYEQLDQLQIGQEIIFLFTSMSHQVLIAFDQIQSDFAIVTRCANFLLFLQEAT